MRNRVPWESRKNSIKLDLNENLWGPSPAVLRAVQRVGAAEISCYPEYNSLINKIAVIHGLRPENVLLTNGADEAIYSIMNTFVKKGDVVLLPVPTFSIYSLVSRISKAKIVEIPFLEDFSFPLVPLLKKLKAKTRLIVLVNPNNPTGTILERKKVKQILARAKGTLVLLDETYAPFSSLRHCDLIEHHPQLIVIGSFSKFHGLAGLRLGYILAAEEKIADLDQVIPPFSVNGIAVVAGEVALGDRRFQKRIRKEISDEKNFMIKNLQKLGVKVYPSGANFLLVRLGARSEKICERLQASKILIKNLNSERLLKGCVRITIGRRKENLLLLEKLSDALPLEAVLFDMDGVLVDVSCSYRMAIKKTAEHFLQQPVDLAEIESYKLRRGFNNDWDVTAAIITSRKMAISRNKIIPIFQQFYFGNHGDGFISREKWMIPRHVLEQLSKKYLLGIVTGRPKKEALFALRKVGIEKYFATVIVEEDTRNRAKPDPWGIQLAMKQIHVSRSAYVGDSPDDMAAAKAAGALPIAILQREKKRRQEWKQCLREAGAKYILPKVSSILEVLG